MGSLEGPFFSYHSKNLKDFLVVFVEHDIFYKIKFIRILFSALTRYKCLIRLKTQLHFRKLPDETKNFAYF